jgi:hypothetical protein
MISSDLAEVRESNSEGEASWPADLDFQLNGVRWQLDGEKEFITTLPSGQELRVSFVMKQDEAGGLYSAFVFVLEGTDFGPFISMYDLTVGVIQERILLLVLILEPLARKILRQTRMADSPEAKQTRKLRLTLDRRPRMEMPTMDPPARVIFDRNNQG